MFPKRFHHLRCGRQQFGRRNNEPSIFFIEPHIDSNLEPVGIRDDYLSLAIASKPPFLAIVINAEHPWGR